MSSLNSKFGAAQTGVLWDIVDCPIPDGLGPDEIYQNIKLALQNMGYHGQVTIKAYSDTNQNKENFESAGFLFFPTGDKHARLRKILRDVYLWAVDNREPSNLMVIKKDASEYSEYAIALSFLKSRDRNILLAQPQSSLSGALLDTVTSFWLWESLSTGGSSLDISGTSGVSRKNHKREIRSDDTYFT